MSTLHTYFQSKYSVLPGTSSDEVLKLAKDEYKRIQKRNPRRQTYIRSAYFKHDKIFINLFWSHVLQKRLIDRTRRLRFYLCGLDLLRHTKLEPEVLLESGDILYRFFGKSKEGEKFCVQVKMNVRTSRKDFISIFPIEKI